MVASGRRPKGSPFDVSVDRTDEHHLWTGATTGKGYGNYWHPERKTNTPAHVFAWERVYGPVPDGYELHHLCHVRLCVDPAHLQPLTVQEHRLIHGKAEVTHCPQGHEYTEANTYIRTGGNGIRQCRACHRIEMAERRARP